ncbi:MAG: MoaD/ThiS family protein [Crocosphaera sp.]|nr:MoaD/ThiS family protein [Crocosphaera sp.]
MSQSFITITVKLFAVYEEVYGVSELVKQVSLETTVNDVLDILIQEHPKLEEWRNVTRFGVNFQFVESNTILKEGDELVFIPPVSGG